MLAGTVAADPVQRRMASGDEVTELRLSVPEAVPSPHNFAVSAHRRPALMQVSTPFTRFWLAAKRSGVRIPLGPLPQVRATTRRLPAPVVQSSLPVLRPSCNRALEECLSEGFLDHLREPHPGEEVVHDTCDGIPDDFLRFRLGEVDPDDQVLVLAERPPWSQHRTLPARVLRESGSQTIEGRVAGRRRKRRFYPRVILTDVMDLGHKEIEAVPGGFSHPISLPGPVNGSALGP